MSPQNQKIAQSIEFNYSQLLDIQGTVLQSFGLTLYAVQKKLIVSNEQVRRLQQISTTVLNMTILHVIFPVTKNVKLLLYVFKDCVYETEDSN